MTGRPSWRGSGAWSFASFSAPLLIGCATIGKHVSPTKVAFTSKPNGAHVKLDDGHECTTPCTIQFDERPKQTAHATLADGRTLDEKLVKRRPHAWFWFNFITIYPVGMLIDLATGSVLTYGQKVVDFDFSTDEDEDETDGKVAKKPPPTPPPPAPPGDAEGEGGAGVATDPLSPEALPRTPAVTKAMASFPEGYLTTEVRYYYGALPAREERQTLARLYRILAEMTDAGERPDVDEAVRRDSFRQAP